VSVNEIISLITLGAVIIGAIVNISTIIGRNETKAVANARVEVKLDNIYAKVDSIEKKQNSIEETLQRQGDRIIKVEESTKSAHHRIDGLEEKIEKKGD
jgi:peptidoglycan hydrolase CwlO-like protein